MEEPSTAGLPPLRLPSLLIRLALPIADMIPRGRFRAEWKLARWIFSDFNLLRDTIRPIASRSVRCQLLVDLFLLAQGAGAK
jgi:hypothetical protein